MMLVTSVRIRRVLGEGGRVSGDITWLHFKLFYQLYVFKKISFLAFYLLETGQFPLCKIGNLFKYYTFSTMNEQIEMINYKKFF